MSTSSKARRAPKRLGTQGRALWSSVTADYDLEQHEVALLTAACRTADRLEDIAEALAGASLTVKNTRGDEIAHPLLVEQRQQGISLSRLLASLRLPTGETEDGDLVRPQRRGAARGSYGIRSVS
jgi:hypothetical protein